jgi:Tfp pilus assembly protein PilV
VRIRSRRGESLVELIVALVVLEIVGVASLAGALAAERLGRHAAQGSAIDAVRWHDYRARETETTCVAASAPDSVRLLFPATPDRPALETLLRCGR